MFFLVLAGCNSSPAPMVSAPIASAASAPTSAPCENVLLSFRPTPAVAYRVRVEERKQVYRSTVTFHPSDSTWNAVEAGFSIEGSTVGDLGDLAGSQLLWRVDAAGTPLEVPEERGTGKYLPMMSVFQFRPFVLPTAVAACAGTEWTREWSRDRRTFSYRYRIDGVRDQTVHVHVDGSAVSSVNRWDTTGDLDVSLVDGFAGEGHLHIRGPDAPKVNDFERHIVIERQ